MKRAGSHRWISNTLALTRKRFYGMPNPDWKEAQVAWQHYLELSTNRNFAYLQLARVSLKRHKKAEALSFLDKVSDSSYSEIIEKLRKQAEAL